MAVLCMYTLTCKASVRQVTLREQFYQHRACQRATSCCCRNYIHLLWQARIWQDYDQDAGKPWTRANWHTLMPIWVPGVVPFTHTASVAFLNMHNKHAWPHASRRLTAFTCPRSQILRVVQMQAAYDEYNDHARSSGKSRGHFIVDLCRPGHLTICLRNFQERIKCNDDNWDAQFGELEAQHLLTDFSPLHKCA